jgi:hypothetical protein
MARLAGIPPGLNRDSEVYTRHVHGVVYDKYERLKEKRAALVAWEQHITTLIGRG